MSAKQFLYTITLNAGSVTGVSFRFLSTEDLPDGGVTGPKLRDSAGCSVMGFSTTVGGSPIDIVASVDNSILVRSSNNVAFVAVTLDSLVGRSASGNIGNIICTAAGRNLIDDADAPTQRATLGLPITEGVRVSNSANISLPTDTNLALTFDSETFDADNYHSTSVNTSRLTVPSGKDGMYCIMGSAVFAAGAGSALREIFLQVNGTTIIAQSSMAVTDSTQRDRLVVCELYRLSAGDYVELIARQQSGSSLNVLALNDYSPTFKMFRVSQ
jgi:hypothetical protein